MRVPRSLFFFLLIACSAQAQKGTKPLFKVASTPVSAEEFIYTFKKNHQHNPQDFTAEKVNEYLDLFINFKLKVTEAKARGLDTTAHFNTEFKTYRSELKKPYKAEEDMLEKLVQQTYQRLHEEVRAAHILLSVNAEAPPADTAAVYQRMQELRSRIVSGESFEKLAREFSQDPSAKVNGGDLGFFTALQMVAPFEEAAYTTPVGGLSPIVRTRFGYHLIQVKGRRPSSGEVEVSHILLRSSGSDEALRNKAFTIHDQLQGGRSWDEVCKEFSDDTNTREQGGRLRAFGIGALASVPEFEAMAFSLQQPGQISDPFQSALGWHIIRLERKIPLPAQKEMEASLRRRLGRDDRVQQSQQAQKDQRKKALQFIEQPQAIEQLMAKGDSTLTNANWAFKPDASRAAEKLFSISGTPYTVGQFVRFAKRNQQLSRLEPHAYARQLYEQWVEEKLDETEEEKLKQQNPDFRNLLNEYREGILLFEIMEKEIWNKAAEDTVGQRRYYEANKQRYQAGDRVEARLFAASDKATITDLISKVTKGDTLTQADLRKLKVVQPYRNYERKDSKAVDAVTWATGLQQAEADGLFYLVEIKRLVPPGIKSFQEARAQLISEYQDYLEKQWLSSLRKKFPVKINNKVRKGVVAELTKK
ncbi:MAG: peptidylprolyl isomerase [Cyclobacteriaceae bacterium]|nr:peptidylprolyl isomerase [Cyclobacteriaceae bacterium]